MARLLSDVGPEQQLEELRIRQWYKRRFLPCPYKIPVEGIPKYIDVDYHNIRLNTLDYVPHRQTR